MRETTVLKSDLLEKVKKNRKLHIEEYKEACDGYRLKALQKLEDVIGELKARGLRVKSGETIGLDSISFGLVVPVSHEKDYDQVIMMLEMSVDEKVRLLSDEFACYVMDDWDWKQQFTASNSFYKNK